ncbi:MAG TPA: aspartate aminotransferase family protein [Candidatus Limnocylindrales bacterium]|jgi:glutamate-1-semialdehyde 2,1-aminomutase
MAIEAGTRRDQLVARYRARTRRSAELFERAAAALPGGSTRTTVFAPPYPPYVEAGSGARVRDVDGNDYLDMLNNYTSLILGHAHPAVTAAVERQLRRGSAFAAPTETEIALAEEIRGRVPSIELLRFTSSGTEATMLALRAARAATGRDLVARFERSYHGTHDQVSGDRRGIPDAVGRLIVDLPWADTAGIERALGGRERELAAVIVEPIQGAGGLRPAEPGFLRFLREYTAAHGILLVFDEIISFRVAPGGVQGRFGIRPDLTTLGKIVGGGHPLAAFGGSAEVMERFDARRPDALPHGGTFNGHPIAAAAGLATLHELTVDAYDHLAALGDRLADRLRHRRAAAGLDDRLSVVQDASLIEVSLGDVDATRDLFLGLLIEGFWIAPRGMGALSTPMSEGDVDAFADAVVRVAAAIMEDAA